MNGPPPFADEPQFRMVHRLAELPPERNLPRGLVLRQATAEDVEGIGRVLTVAFEETWDVERVLRDLLNDPEVPNTFVVEDRDRIVATASYQVKPAEFPNCGWVHWVGADPAMAGQGLGYIASLEVLKEAKRRNNDRVRLLTNDHRLPAIATYLKLGFEPDPYYESHPQRWADVMARFGKRT